MYRYDDEKKEFMGYSKWVTAAVILQTKRKLTK